MKFVVQNAENAPDPTTLTITLAIEDFKDAAAAASVFQVVAGYVANKNSLSIMQMLMFFASLFEK